MKQNSSASMGRSKKTIAIIIIIITLVLIPLFLFRIFTNNIVDKITQTISLQYSREMNEQMSDHITSNLEYYYHELNTEFNALKHIENLDENKLRDFISETETANETSYLAFADNEGYVYEADGSYLGTIRISMLGTLLNGTQKTIADNVTIGNESYILIGELFDDTVCIDDRDICIGLLGMKNDELTEHIVLYSDYSGGFSSIINADGSYVVKNPADPNSGLNIFSIINKNFNITESELTALKDNISRGQVYFLNADSTENENSVYLYFAPIDDTQWYIVNTLPSSFIKDNVVDLRNTMETVYTAFVLLFILIATIVIVEQMLSRSKLKKSQTELKNALELAEEASNAKTNFLFSMSHDIRTPMNAILGYTDIGLKHVDDAEISKDSYQKIKMAGGHLLNLINDILEMSRIESGKMELVENPIDIRESISDISIMSQSLAIEKSIDFETYIGELKNPYIYADELHVNEVIINIISNAVKYTPNGGKVKYTINQINDADDGKALFRFEISDNGIGMSQEFQEHLFETFSREQNTTISKTEGTGLGLSIVKRIVDMAGGQIKVNSIQNVGSTFTVEFNFNVLDDKSIEKFLADKNEYKDISSSTNFSGMKVLLTEDNELNREIATYILEDSGFEVDTAEDGKIAVNLVTKNGTDYYDFILMDIQMPVMNGYEATKKIRELPGGKNIPIIALSANAFEEDRIKSASEGMNGHVAKPIDTKILLQTMQSLIK